MPLKCSPTAIPVVVMCFILTIIQSLQSLVCDNSSQRLEPFELQKVKLVSSPDSLGSFYHMGSPPAIHRIYLSQTHNTNLLEAPNPYTSLPTCCLPNFSCMPLSTKQQRHHSQSAQQNSLNLQHPQPTNISSNKLEQLLNNFHQLQLHLHIHKWHKKASNHYPYCSRIPPQSPQPNSRRADTKKA